MTERASPSEPPPLATASSAASIPGGDEQRHRRGTQQSLIHQMPFARWWWASRSTRTSWRRPSARRWRQAACGCARRRFELALVDAGLPEAAAVVRRPDLRDRREGRSLILFSGDDAATGAAQQGAETVDLAQAGAAVVAALRAAGAAEANV